MKKNNQNIQNGAELQGRTGPRTDRQILEKHAGVQEKVHGYMKKGKLRRIIAILSAFVLLFTLNTLKFKADTLQHLPMCGLTEHVHSEACYNEAGELVCGLAEHEHTDACYQQRPVQPEPTVFDEFMDLNSQVVLASPMDDEDVNISSENVDEAVGETSLDLDADGADFNAEADSFNGLEVEYDLEDLYDDSGDDSVTVDDVADNNTESEDNADEAEIDYSLDGGSVAFLSDIMKAAGLGISGVTAVGEIVNDTFVEAHISGFDFATKLYEQAKGLGAEFKFEKVVGLRDENGVKTVVTTKNEYEAKTVILATGSENRKLGVEGEDALVGRGISYCATCDGAFFRKKTVAVVGGGNTALEDALYLADLAEKVYLIHRRDTFRGEDATVQKLAARENVEFVYNSTVTALHAEKRLNAIDVTNKDGSVRTIEVKGLFVAVGRIPENQNFASLVELDPAGYAVAGEDCRTKTPGVFVAADNRTKNVRQLVTAAADGAVAATAAIAAIADF